MDARAASCSAEGSSSSSSLSLSLSDHDSHPGAPIMGFSRRTTGVGFGWDICRLRGMGGVVVQRVCSGFVLGQGFSVSSCGELRLYGVLSFCALEAVGRGRGPEVGDGSPTVMRYW